jgi:hypothetical protein
MLKDITEAQKTPNEAASFSTYGAENTGVSPAELKSGFSKESMSTHADQEGNTREGNPYERAGFLSPVLSNTR